MAREVKGQLTGKKKDQPTLQAVIDEWVALQSPHWTSQKYHDTVVYRLGYISADFAHRPIDEITRQEISSKVKEIIAKGTLETATRAIRLLKSVFNFAISSDYTQNNPCFACR